MPDRFDILRKKYKLSQIDKKNITNLQLNSDEIDNFKENKIDESISDLKLLLEYEKSRENVYENYFKNKENVTKFLNENSENINNNEKIIEKLVKEIKVISTKNKNLQEKYKLEKTSLTHYQIINNIKKINNSLGDVQVFLENMGIASKILKN